MAVRAQRQQQTTPSWQNHKSNDSVDSEISYFETTSSSTSDSWSSYFESWETQPQDAYCPEIVSNTSSRWHNENMMTSHHNQFKPEDITLPEACKPGRPQTSRHAYSRSEIITLPGACKERRPEYRSVPAPPRKQVQPVSRAKRYGLVSHGNVQAEKEAINGLNSVLQNSSASTEDVLAAMYSPSWDVASLQRWYQQTPRGPSDLALYKIMFSLRYAPEEQASR